VRDGRIEHRLQRGVRLRLDQVDDRGAELLQRPDHLDPVLGGGVAGPEVVDRRPCFRMSQPLPPPKVSPAMPVRHQRTSEGPLSGHSGYTVGWPELPRSGQDTLLRRP